MVQRTNLIYGPQELTEIKRCYPQNCFQPEVQRLDGYDSHVCPRAQRILNYQPSAMYKGRVEIRL